MGTNAAESALGVQGRARWQSEEDGFNPPRWDERRAATSSSSPPPLLHPSITITQTHYRHQSWRRQIRRRFLLQPAGAVRRGRSWNLGRFVFRGRRATPALRFMSAQANEPLAQVLIVQTGSFRMLVEAPPPGRPSEMCRKEAEVTCSHRPRPERENRSEIIKENQREIIQDQREVRHF